MHTPKTPPPVPLTTGVLDGVTSPAVEMAPGQHSLDAHIATLNDIEVRVALLVLCLGPQGVLFDVTVTDIARKVDRHRSQVSRALGSLEALGFLTRCGGSRPNLSTISLHSASGWWETTDGKDEIVMPPAAATRGAPKASVDQAKISTKPQVDETLRAHEGRPAWQAEAEIWQEAKPAITMPRKATNAEPVDAESNEDTVRSSLGHQEAASGPRGLGGVPQESAASSVNPVVVVSSGRLDANDVAMLRAAQARGHAALAQQREDERMDNFAESLPPAFRGAVKSPPRPFDPHARVAPGTLAPTVVPVAPMPGAGAGRPGAAPAAPAMPAATAVVQAPAPAPVPRPRPPVPFVPLATRVGAPTEDAPAEGVSSRVHASAPSHAPAPVLGITSSSDLSSSSPSYSPLSQKNHSSIVRSSPPDHGRKSAVADSLPPTAGQQASTHACESEQVRAGERVSARGESVVGQRVKDETTGSKVSEGKKASTSGEGNDDDELEAFFATPAPSEPAVTAATSPTAMPRSVAKKEPTTKDLAASPGSVVETTRSSESPAPPPPEGAGAEGGVPLSFEEINQYLRSILPLEAPDNFRIAVISRLPRGTTVAALKRYVEAELPRLIANPKVQYKFGCLFSASQIEERFRPYLAEIDAARAVREQIARDTEDAVSRGYFNRGTAQPKEVVVEGDFSPPEGLNWRAVIESDKPLPRPAPVVAPLVIDTSKTDAERVAKQLSKQQQLADFKALERLLAMKAAPDATPPVPAPPPAASSWTAR